jgi:hypothetical protein
VSANTRALRRLGIDTYTDPVVFLRRDCHVCLAHETNAIDVSGLVAKNMESSVYEPKSR